MFKYEEFSEDKKRFIELVGDHTKTRILDSLTESKGLKAIYESYYNQKMTYEKFIAFTEEVYYDGLISYVPASIYMVDNLSENAKVLLENNFELEETWRNQSGLIRLTHQGERTISGTDIYLQIIKENVADQYTLLDSILTKTDAMKEDYDLIKRQLDGGLIKNIEILSIFIAIVALIGGNISIFSNYTFSSVYELIILLLVTNAILLFVFMAFLIMMKRIIISDNKGKLFGELKSIIFPIILILIALIVAA